MKHAVISLIHTITEQLKNRFGIPEQHAWWILEEITKKNKAQLLAQETIELTAAQEQKLQIWIDKLVNQNMPLQYLIGSVSFADLEILVEPPVLIPRPETEQWCLNLITQLKKLKKQNLAILDLCTGSGCIALALAKALPSAKIYATDISKQALALAHKNAIHNQINTVTFLHSDLFADISTAFTFDLIVCNPPYVSPSEWQSLEPSVTQWEDKNALVANNEGLAIIKKIISHAPAYLHANNEMKQHDIPQLIIEIGYKQADTVQKLMESHGFSTIQIQKDLAGKDRIVCGRVEHVATTDNQK
ncbi:MAG: peptide chain release factor N(5)-glutamine methyltransferase [bacterium]|nr:peptide chain release factor N(5)-glutamine methyltransferase [bacterium]